MTQKHRLDPPKAELEFRVTEAFRDGKGRAYHTVHLLISDLEEVKDRNPAQPMIVGGVRSEGNFVVTGGKRLDAECLFHGQTWGEIMQDYPYIFKPERLAYQTDGLHRGIIQLRFRWTSLDKDWRSSGWVERRFTVDEYDLIIQKQIERSVSGKRLEQQRNDPESTHQDCP